MTTVSSAISSAQSSDLVFVSQTNELVTDSIHVAKYFGKQHKDVLKKLKSLDCSSEFNGRNFALVHHHDAKGEIRPMFQMTKDGFMFLVMGFTGKRAAEIKERYINAFNEMQNQLSGQNLTTGLTSAIKQFVITIESDKLSGKLISDNTFLTSPGMLASQLKESFDSFTQDQLLDIGSAALQGARLKQ